VLNVITVVSPNWSGSAPESWATVLPVVAFCQMPAAMFFGKRDVARCENGHDWPLSC
jgi:hypothetical protein